MKLDWDKLDRIMEEAGYATASRPDGYVTAAEYARHVGISRCAAVGRLEKLVAQGKMVRLSVLDRCGSGMRRMNVYGIPHQRGPGRRG